MLSRPNPAFPLAAENAALLLLDAQRFTTLRDEGLGRFASEQGILREFEEYYEQTDAALRNMTSLLAACRRYGLRVIYSVLCAQEPDRSDLSRQLRLSGLPIPVSSPREEIRPEVAPVPGDLVLSRGTYSPFAAGPVLLDTLREAGIDTIILAGMLANTTVALAAREAADRDLGVVLAWDASASETLGWHEIIKTGLVGPLICMRTVQQVIEMLEGVRT
jgi:nicotinamidase-related amidase